MRAEEIRGLTDDEIEARLLDTREELMRLRFQQSTGELTDYTRMKFTRRTIARLLTVLNERRLEALEEGE